MLDKAKQFVCLYWNWLKNLDPFFLFPCFVFVVGLIGLFLTEFDFLKVLAFLTLIALLHFIYLQVNPYINKSDYYKYLALRQKYLTENKIVVDLLTPKQKYMVQYGLLIVTILILKASEYYDFLCVVQAFLFALFALQNTIDILNVIRCPQLPDSIRIHHPFYMQKRFLPYWTPILEKIGTKYLPACGYVLKTIAGGLGVSVGAYKYFNGALAIDPIRNRLINYYHELPSDAEWNETRLAIFKKFHNHYQLLNPTASPAEAYQAFCSKEAILTKLLEEVVFDADL